MEEGEISSDSELAPSVLEVPTINWTNYIGIKNVQYIKMGHAPRVQALEQYSWDLEQTVRETEKELAKDLQLLMTETTNDPKLLKNTCMPGASTVRHHSEREQPLQKEAVNKLWSSILRRQNHSTNQPENNGHKPAAQRTSSHKQDDSFRKAFLVAQTDGSHTTKMRQLHTVQTIR